MHNIHGVKTIAFGVLFNRILQSQSDWSPFNGMWQKRRRELDHRLRPDSQQMTFQMQQAHAIAPQSSVCNRMWQRRQREQED